MKQPAPNDEQWKKLMLEFSDDGSTDDCPRVRKQSAPPRRGKKPTKQNSKKRLVKENSKKKLLVKENSKKKLVVEEDSKKKLLVEEEDTTSSKKKNRRDRRADLKKSKSDSRLLSKQLMGDNNDSSSDLKKKKNNMLLSSSNHEMTSSSEAFHEKMSSSTSEFDMTSGAFTEATMQSSATSLGLFSVSFGCVEVREYQRIMDINPWTNGSAPSFTLGWKYNVKEPIELEKHEGALERRRSRRNMKASLKKNEEEAKKKKKKKRSLSPFRSLLSSSKKKDSDNNKIASARSSTVTGADGVAIALLSQKCKPLLPAQREALAERLGYSKTEIKENVIRLTRAQKRRGEENRMALQEGKADIQQAMAEVMENTLANASKYTLQRESRMMIIQD